MNNVERFTNRVADYVKYRPSYPAAYIEYLLKDVGFDKYSTVADIGAGTGILSKLLSTHVKKVIAVEPNAEMRRTAAEYCKDAPNITVVEGSAEATGLESGAVDFITAAQAFHWFDISESKLEFQRILKPGGKVCLVWNVRDITTASGAEYENIIRQNCLNYTGSGGGSAETLPYSRLFKNGAYEYREFPNDRHIDLETLIGYSLSTSYAPVKGDDRFPGFIKQLVNVFNKYAEDGKMELSTTTQSYAGEV